MPSPLKIKNQYSSDNDKALLPDISVKPTQK